MYSRPDIRSSIKGNKILYDLKILKVSIILDWYHYEVETDSTLSCKQRHFKKYI